MADTELDGLRDLLLDMSQRCKAVVGCRVSPDQKRYLPIAIGRWAAWCTVGGNCIL
jgi:hypothetical protein